MSEAPDRRLFPYDLVFLVNLNNFVISKCVNCLLFDKTPIKHNIDNADLYDGLKFTSNLEVKY